MRPLPICATTPARQPALLVAITVLSALLLTALLAGQWPDYTYVLDSLDEPISRLRWVVGDITEFAFYKHELPAIGLLLGACIGHLAWLHGSRWQGFAISYGSGRWPWVCISSLLGLLLSHLLWGWTLHPGQWQPTFVAFVSLPAATVLLYGAGWRVAVSGAAAGAVLVTPASLVLVNAVCLPLELPVVVGNVGGMALASLLAFGVFRCLPGLVRGGVVDVQPLRSSPSVARHHGIVWTLRRVLADFSEAPFFGNEWASLGLLLGAALAEWLAPAATAYGSSLLLPIVAGQVLASSLGVLVWRSQWQRLGWYPTYVPVVSVVPAAILVLGAGWPVVIGSAVLGALTAPPLAATISRRLPHYVHGYVGNVLSMAITTLWVVPVLSLIGGEVA